MSDPVPVIEDSPKLLLERLQARADRLLGEFKAFQSCLRQNDLQREVELRVFRRGIESESKVLSSIAKQQAASVVDRGNEEYGDELTERDRAHLHALKSSNLPFYDAVWHVAKQRKAIVALGKKMYWTRSGTSQHDGHLADTTVQGRTSPGFRPKEKNSVVVDIVSDQGKEWIKVSTITEKRLLFEMAKEGWETYGDQSESDDSNLSDAEDTHPDGQRSGGKLELVQLAEQMTRAARLHRVNFQHPRVILVLTKVQEGRLPDIDALVADIRDTGAHVVCGENHSEGTDDLNIRFAELHMNTVSSHVDYQMLMPNPSPLILTPTLNIDCTILLALISDISHVPKSALPPSPQNQSGTYHTAILKQIEAEQQTALLPTELYGLMAGRTLTCTSHAAQRMKDIALTMGTDDEKQRKDIFFAAGAYKDHTCFQLLQALRAVSCHPVPDDLQLPISIVEFNTSGHFNGTQSPRDKISSNHLLSRTISIAARLTNKIPLSQINSSVFLYGWLNDITTVTSNRVIAQAITKAINDLLDDDDDNNNNGEEEKAEEKRHLPSANNKSTPSSPRRYTNKDQDKNPRQEKTTFHGPKVYICETARSLVGKEKQGTRPLQNRQ